VSSFCSEAAARGCDVIAADPIYDMPAQIIGDRCGTDLEDSVRQLPGIMHNYKWAFYGDGEGLRAHRQHAYRSFLEDYKQGRTRYVTASLPRTPFVDDEFSLTLVSHFLFLYEDRFDYDFHKKSILELARVTKDEVRIYPLSNLKAQRSPLVEKLTEDEECAALSFSVTRTDFEFLKNANELLTIRKRANGRLLG
jgi:hypothetical protein